VTILEDIKLCLDVIEATDRLQEAEKLDWRMAGEIQRVAREVLDSVLPLTGKEEKRE
jgi:hypothetical protein